MQYPHRTSDSKLVCPLVPYMWVTSVLCTTLLFFDVLSYFLSTLTIRYPDGALIGIAALLAILAIPLPPALLLEHIRRSHERVGIFSLWVIARPRVGVGDVTSSLDWVTAWIFAYGCGLYVAFLTGATTGVILLTNRAKMNASPRSVYRGRTLRNCTG